MEKETSRCFVCKHSDVVFGDHSGLLLLRMSSLVLQRVSANAVDAVAVVIVGSREKEEKKTLTRKIIIFSVS